jgi:molecular chaperone DnaK
MKEEAEAFAEEDEIRKQRIELKNKADKVIDLAEDLLEEHSEELSEGKKSVLKEEIQGVTEDVNNEDLALNEVEESIDFLREKVEETKAEL